MFLQYGSGGSLIYANKNILVFRNVTYIELEDVTDNFNNEIEMNVFQSYLDRHNKFLSTQNQILMILNKDIDKLVIRQFKTDKFPNTN